MSKNERPLAPFGFITGSVAALFFAAAYYNNKQANEELKNIKYIDPNDPNQLNKIKPGIYGFKNNGGVKMIEIFEKRTEVSMEKNAKETIETKLPNGQKTTITTSVYKPSVKKSYNKIWREMSNFLPNVPQDFSKFESLFPKDILNTTTKSGFNVLKEIAENNGFSLSGFLGKEYKKYKVKYGEISRYKYPEIYLYLEESNSHNRPVVRYAAPKPTQITDKLYPVFAQFGMGCLLTLGTISLFLIRD